ncbi:MAG TPA: ATP-binding cassette domain-containing protein [Candidatus Eisenbergiella pullistercoris]|uniref:ATP-binding cassette domain-containing protein n=1 Tax=Candidatus Eisenbergiella pullistercoris TaxID=2838555 RepID=A0A9D1YR49_9FIRM|nr:ATP-binding cassette domain-containing protein [Candidatus Eisenbergiella pullistercoris]
MKRTQAKNPLPGSPSQSCLLQDHILEVEDLCVSYERQKSRLFEKEESMQVLHDVSFFIRKGEVLGLVGESGCGKSTLSRAILGLQPRYEGAIRCAAARPQMVFQDPYSSLNPAKRVGWILEEPLKLNTALSAKERRQRALAMLERVGLEEKIVDRFPRQLSGGQRQRVCIAESLMLEPSLLIADEPVSALDVTIQAQILELLSRLQKEMGLAILFISHDMRVVYQLSQRVMVMKEGRIVESGDVDEVYFHPRHPYTKELLEAAGIEGEEERPETDAGADGAAAGKGTDERRRADA